MKVFIVVAGWIYESTEVIGVFSDMAAAENYATVIKQNKRANYDMVIVKEFIVDSLK